MNGACGALEVSADTVKEGFLARLASAAKLESALTFRSDAAGCAVKPAGSAEWTNALLNMVLGLGVALGFQVYPRRKYFARKSRGTNSDFDRPMRGDDRGEWLVDAAWGRYDGGADWVDALRAAPPRKAHDLVLACESEWAAGRYGAQSADEHVALVLGDFAKLVDVRASLKVMIFSFLPQTPNGVASFDDIVNLCGAAATPIAPGEHYLLFGWPFDASWDERLTTLRMASFGGGCPPG